MEDNDMGPSHSPLTALGWGGSVDWGTEGPDQSGLDDTVGLAIAPAYCRTVHNLGQVGTFRSLAS